MKTSVIVLLFLLVGLTSCDDSIFTKKIVIKGRIASAGKVGPARVRAAYDAYSLSDAKKALIFYGNEYNLVEIKEDGSFSGKAPVGSATVIAFLTSDNQFIGNLFAGGLNVLPLVGLAADLTTIDLSTLTLDGTRVIPSNNPIGSQIQLTDEEFVFLRDVGAYYESLAKNIDMDKDGTPDILGGNQILVNSQVRVEVGTFGTNDAPPVLSDRSRFQVNSFIRIEGDAKLYNNSFKAKLEGPEGNPYSLIEVEGGNADHRDCFIFQIKHIGMDHNNSYSGFFLPFEDGVYAFTLAENRKYTFTHKNVDMGNYMVIVVPTVYADDKGYISKIGYEFQLPDGTVVNPRNLLSSYIRVQIDGNNQQLYEGRHLYGAYFLDNYDYYNEKISERIKLSDVSNINLAYIDLLGNEYEMLWKKR